jgi:hypothetical protein
MTKIIKPPASGKPKVGIPAKDIQTGEILKIVKKNARIIKGKKTNRKMGTGRGHGVAKKK